jgi:hypothetical protein
VVDVISGSVGRVSPIRKIRPLWQGLEMIGAASGIGFDFWES